jgi:hypothetical protein
MRCLRTGYAHTFPQHVVAQQPMDTNSSKGPEPAQAAREQIFLELLIRELRRRAAQEMGGKPYRPEIAFKSKT